MPRPNFLNLSDDDAALDRARYVLAAGPLRPHGDLQEGRRTRAAGDPRGVHAARAVGRGDGRRGLEGRHPHRGAGHHRRDARRAGGAARAALPGVARRRPSGGRVPRRRAQHLPRADPCGGVAAPGSRRPPRGRPCGRPSRVRRDRVRPRLHLPQDRRARARGAGRHPLGVAGRGRVPREEPRIRTFWAHHLRREPTRAAWIAQVIDDLGPAGRPLYLSIDVDGLDPGIMPGTGTPEPGGLSWSDLVELIHGRGRALRDRRASTWSR